MSQDCTNGGSVCTPNMSIRCGVNTCAHHCQDAAYCGLDTIEVDAHERDPRSVQSIDCRSFECLG